MSERYDAAVRAGRFRNRLYEAVIKTLEIAARSRGLTMATIAARLGRTPAEIDQMLSGPGDWTLDTVSDLLLAAGADMEFCAVLDEDR